MRETLVLKASRDFPRNEDLTEILQAAPDQLREVLKEVRLLDFMAERMGEPGLETVIKIAAGNQNKSVSAFQQAVQSGRTLTEVSAKAGWDQKVLQEALRGRLLRAAALQWPPQRLMEKVLASGLKAFISARNQPPAEMMEKLATALEKEAKSGAVTQLQAVWEDIRGMVVDPVASQAEAELEALGAPENVQDADQKAESRVEEMADQLESEDVEKLQEAISAEKGAEKVEGEREIASNLEADEVDLSGKLEEKDKGTNTSELAEGDEESASEPLAEMQVKEKAGLEDLTNEGKGSDSVDFAHTNEKGEKEEAKQQVMKEQAAEAEMEEMNTVSKPDAQDSKPETHSENTVASDESESVKSAESF
ncbi:MAG: hypothetical protein AAF570_27795, partial [Bacteroidota bacterium]